MKLLHLILAIVCLISCKRGSIQENRVAATFHSEEGTADYQTDLSKRKVFSSPIVIASPTPAAEAQSKTKASVLIHPPGFSRPPKGYIPYKIGNRVFLTSKKLYLKPGELLPK